MRRRNPSRASLSTIIGGRPPQYLDAAGRGTWARASRSKVGHDTILRAQVGAVSMIGEPSEIPIGLTSKFFEQATKSGNLIGNSIFSQCMPIGRGVNGNDGLAQP